MVSTSYTRGFTMQLTRCLPETAYYILTYSLNQEQPTWEHTEMLYHEKIFVGNPTPQNILVLQKSAHEQNTSRLPKRGWVLFEVFPHLTTKEHPCYVYSDLMPQKHIVG